jgi:hypothetical protein
MDDQNNLFPVESEASAPASLRLDYIDKHLMRLVDEIGRRDKWCRLMSDEVREDVISTIFGDLRFQIDKWLEHIDDYQGCPP